MKSELRRAALVLMLPGLYGCGLKGPLYFPPADKADKSEQKYQLTTTPSSTQSLVQTASPGDDGNAPPSGPNSRNRDTVASCRQTRLLRYRLLSGVGYAVLQNARLG